MTPQPALYAGIVRHRRHAPRPHTFGYRLFMAFLDIDRLPGAMNASRLTGYNQWNCAAFHERDHFGDPALPLRERLHTSAAAAGLILPDGPVYLLTHLRYFGYVFNPISLFYCYDRTNHVRLVLAEVNNTYGGRRMYWLTPCGDPARCFRAIAPKSMYVSPFMPPAVDYEFLLTPPAANLVAHMNVRRTGAAGARPIFDATLRLDRQPWTARSIRRALVRMPWMTAKVTAAIHWEALRLRAKRLPVYPLHAKQSKERNASTG